MILFQMITGKWVSAAIGMVAQFSIADHLADGPKSVDELAQLSNTHAAALYRLLRATASIGIFTELPDGRFAQTELSAALQEGQGPRSLAMFFLDDWHMRAWASMPAAVQTGKPAVDLTFGMSGFDFFEKYPQQAVNFNNAMTDLSRAQAPGVAMSYDFRKFQCLADVGGGLGFLLSNILLKTPQLRGMLCELPYVIEQARSGPILAPFQDRVEFSAGSFLDSLPSGADAFIMKHILHDWDDQDCIKILKNIRKVIPSTGTLLVVDRVVGAPNEPDVAKLMDLEMMMIGGRERTEPEWRALFAAGGFTLQRVIPTPIPGGLPIIEGTPC